MQHAQITASQQIKPSFAFGGRPVDVTDVWLEETDPENERGEVCTAFLHDEGRGFELKGISVEDNSGRFYGDRDFTLTMIGTDAIWRIEECEWEASL